MAQKANIEQKSAEAGTVPTARCVTSTVDKVAACPKRHHNPPTVPGHSPEEGSGCRQSISRPGSNTRWSGQPGACAPARCWKAAVAMEGAHAARVTLP
jgi:hypothetical protein